MNNARINGTRWIGDLISMAMPFNVMAEPSTFPQTRNEVSMLLSQVEGGDPVRSAERVPKSSSHYLDSLEAASRKQNCAGTPEGIDVAAA